MYANDRDVKVLHLPSNISSQISVAVRALRDVGVEARGLAVGNARSADSTGIKSLEPVSRRRHPVRGVLRTAAICKALARGMQWADIIHWHFGASVTPLDWDLKYAAWLEKPRIVTFWGSDIRIPEVASRDNAYVARLYEAHPELSPNGKNAPRRMQERFAQRGFECIVPGFELKYYLRKDLFPNPFESRAGLILSEFEARYPNPMNTRLMLVHSPSHLLRKGTDALLKAVEELRKRGYAFDFRLLHKVPRAEALSIVRESDVFLDQFVLGSHGLAALEAMAFGKPAVCYIKPSLLPQYPSDFPLVNANQDNLAEVLGGLLDDGRRRHDIGRRSRAYVEKHHDAHKIARQLVGIYEELLEKNRSRKRRERP